MPPVRTRALFSGTVQGVGFRWTARDIAATFAVAGYARNLSDGRVEIVAEGEEKVVNSFIAAVRARMDRYISGVEAKNEPPTGERRGFEIRM